jgi:hypothetical protein
MSSSIVASVASFLQDSAWDSECDRASIDCFLNWSADSSAFSNRCELFASIRSKEYPALAKCRAARATMDFCRAASSRA